MTAGSFLIALAALSIGTYLMRFAGVKLGAAIATKGRVPEPAASAGMADASAGASNEPTGDDVQEELGGPTSRVTMWMDRATVVLIGAVFATTAIFDGQDIADPARLIGVGAGVFAAIVRVPMLVAVFLGMGVCALIRLTGIL